MEFVSSDLVGHPMVPDQKKILFRGGIKIVNSSQARYDWQKAHSVGSQSGLVKRKTL